MNARNDSNSNSSISLFTMDTSNNIYASPTPSTAASSRACLYVSSPSQSRSNLSTLNPTVLEPPDRSRIHKVCGKLEHSVFKLRVLFYVLTASCVLIVALYVALIAIFLTAWPEITNQPRSGDAQHGGRNSPPQQRTGNGNEGKSAASGLCLESEKVREFVDSWRREDKEGIRVLMGQGDYVHTYTPGVSDVHCFGNLKWVLKAFGKMNSAVRESLDYIESKQGEINETSQCCMSVDRDSLDVCLAGEATKDDDEDDSYKDRVVFAHYFLNSSATYNNNKTDGLSVLQWIVSSQHDGSSVRKVSKNARPVREIVIRHAGFYYVYSHVTFHDNVIVTHRVVLNRKQTTKVLMSFTGGTRTVSSLQGMFELMPHDSLSVHVTTKYLHTALEDSTYFGTYLVRT